MTDYDKALGDAINEAAKDLPPGYQVVIEIERHGYNVELKGKGTVIESNIDGEHLLDDVKLALAKARKMAS